MIKLILPIALLFFPTLGLASESQSELISKLNQELKELKGKPSPILIIDRDELEARYIQAGLYVDPGSDIPNEVEVARQAIVKDYVAEKSGVEMEDNHAFNLEMMTRISKGAFAFQWTDGYYDPTQYFCTVTPASPNYNRMQHNERLLGLHMKKAFPDHNGSHITELASKEDMELMSILHEVSHCMDRKFLPVATRFQESASNFHQAEAFAEILGALLTVRRKPDFNLRHRAEMRMTYSWLIAPYLQTLKGAALQNPVAQEMGTVYALYRPLMATQKYIETHNIKEMKLIELMQAAQEIVEKAGHETRQFTMMNGYFAAPDKSEYIKEVRNRADRYPELFMDAFLSFIGYITQAPIISATFLQDQPVRPDYSFEMAPAPDWDLQALAQENITSCELGDIENFLKFTQSELRRRAQEYDGYDLRYLDQAHTEVAKLAHMRLMALACVGEPQWLKATQSSSLEPLFEFHPSLKR